MINYKRINFICGWVAFAIAALAYGLTVEPSVSFWDCPEFITSGSKLEVGHPPGAPIFMLTANLFSHLSTDVSHIALLVNGMNALFSAGCILFLFWTITRLLFILLKDKEEQINTGKIVLVMSSGFCGALVYAFSDTFWFSAVEGEVYAFSSFLTALTFWIILKWEEDSHSVQSDRWLILLAYLIGLSIGVHLLNLLCIPAIVFVFYYKKTLHPTPKGGLVALLFSFLLIAFVLYGIVPGIMKMAGIVELFFVNQCGFPFHSGTLLYAFVLLLVLSSTVLLTHYTGGIRLLISFFIVCCLLLGVTLCANGLQTVALTLFFSFSVGYLLYKKLCAIPQQALRVLNTLTLSLLVIVLGYSSYALIVIRSVANPPMDQQSPEDPFALKDYLAREQYGDKPLLYGPTFLSPRALKESGHFYVYEYKNGEAVYRKSSANQSGGKDYYQPAGYKIEPQYQLETCVWFPRMHDTRHANGYRDWLGTMNGKTVTYFDKASSRNVVLEIPSMQDNLRFFFSYQLNYMYWRYFLWNFVGRQNDIQGSGQLEYGNWITGISFIDRLLIGDETLLPDYLKQNKGRNVYYALPLLLGIMGMIWQVSRGKKGVQQFNVVLLLFFMTGIAIVLYLNQTPHEPRERDYAYAGSFYAFSIWVGMGVAALAHFLSRKIKMKVSVAFATLVAWAVPLQVLGQTADDHNRSGRYLCRDMGKNYLMSMSEKGCPIIFVNGDNETFPLWYNQEVEGFRTDTRVCNLMYLTGGWYVEQMRRPAYCSPGLPFSLAPQFCRDGVNDAVPVNPIVNYTIDEAGNRHEVRVKDYIEKIYRDNPGKYPYGKDPFEWSNIVKYWLSSSDEDLRCIPTDEVHISIDKVAVAHSGMRIPSGVELPQFMKINLKDRSYLIRPGILLVDLISSCNWERPLYVAVTCNLNEYLDIKNYLVCEGMASRIVPYRTDSLVENTNTQEMYKNVMTRFKFGGLDNKSLYMDETNTRMAVVLHRQLVQLAEELYKEGDTRKALQVLQQCSKKIPFSALQNAEYTRVGRMGLLYHLLGETEQGRKVWQTDYDKQLQYLRWYEGMSDSRLKQNKKECIEKIYLTNDLLSEAVYAGMLTGTDDIACFLRYVSKLRVRFVGFGTEYTAFVNTLNTLLKEYQNLNPSGVISRK